jgi:hypothetical protein
MTALKLGYGLRSIPEEVSTAWGARWIFPNDMVHNRQDLKGENTDALIAWLNGGAIKAALIEARELVRRWEMFPSSDKTLVLYEDETGKIVGNPQSSHGYLYVAGWLKADAPTQPQFKPGDRVFSHYTMQWGTVERVKNTVRDATHGVTGAALPDTTWYRVRSDDGSIELLDDAHGDWDMARIVPPDVAERNGYGTDPKAAI